METPDLTINKRSLMPDTSCKHFNIVFLNALYYSNPYLVQDQSKAGISGKHLWFVMVTVYSSNIEKLIEIF